MSPVRRHGRGNCHFECSTFHLTDDLARGVPRLACLEAPVALLSLPRGTYPSLGASIPGSARMTAITRGFLFSCTGNMKHKERKSKSERLSQPSFEMCAAPAAGPGRGGPRERAT